MNIPRFLLSGFHFAPFWNPQSKTGKKRTWPFSNLELSLKIAGIFADFLQKFALLAGPAGGHPPGCPHRAGLISQKKKEKKMFANFARILLNCC